MIRPFGFNFITCKTSLGELHVRIFYPFKRHVSWRGKRFLLGAGTLLYLDRARVSQA